MLSAIVTVSGITATTHLARVPLAAWGALSFLIVASTLIGYAIFLALDAHAFGKAGSRLTSPAWL